MIVALLLHPRGSNRLGYQPRHIKRIERIASYPLSLQFPNRVKLDRSPFS